jgi:hypothetical protein
LAPRIRDERDAGLAQEGGLKLMLGALHARVRGASPNSSEAVQALIVEKQITHDCGSLVPISRRRLLL